jgi:hypothetical protein
MRSVLNSAPNALALSRDGKTVYVANAANNAVAIVKPDDRNPIQGFIPTGWYPTAVALSADDRRLGIASGYGFGSLAATPAGQKGRSYKDRVGVVSVLDLPTPSRLKSFTQQVLANNRAEQAPSKKPAGGIPYRWDRANHRLSVTSSISSRKTEPMIRCSVTSRVETETPPWCSSGVKSRQITTL